MTSRTKSGRGVYVPASTYPSKRILFDKLGEYPAVAFILNNKTNILYIAKDMRFIKNYTGDSNAPHKITTTNEYRVELVLESAEGNGSEQPLEYLRASVLDESLEMNKQGYADTVTWTVLNQPFRIEKAFQTMLVETDMSPSKFAEQPVDMESTFTVMNDQCYVTLLNKESNTFMMVTDVHKFVPSTNLLNQSYVTGAVNPVYSTILPNTTKNKP
jgi:hypothetical protein